MSNVLYVIMFARPRLRFYLTQVFYRSGIFHDGGGKLSQQQYRPVERFMFIAVFCLVKAKTKLKVEQQVHIFFLQYSSKYWTRQKYISCSALRHIFHRFSTFNCCLSVVLQLGKGDYTECLHFVFCSNKQCSFEPFMCVDQVHIDLHMTVFDLCL